MNTVIEKLEYHLPEQVITNQDLEKQFPDWSSERIEKKLGVKERHIVKQNETSLDLGYQAALKVLSPSDIESIDFLLFCTQSPDYFLPTSACVLQDKLKLRTTIGALDFNLGCSGFIYGLALAKSLIKSELAQRVLLITSETYSKFIHPKDKANRSIFGDGASSTIISASESEKILHFDLGTDGMGKNNLIVPAGAMRNQININPEETVDESGNIRTDNNLYMNGPEIFNFTINNVPITVEQCLKKNNLTLDEINFVIFHQANKYMLNHLQRKLRIPNDKFYVDMENTGNTVSSTIPIALKKSLEKGLVKKGDKVLLAGFGVGYSWGATIIIIN